MPTSNEKTTDPAAGASNEVATKPPIMICEICEVIQLPESSRKQHGGPDLIPFYMLKEATRKGCHFCRTILTAANFFQNTIDQNDESKRGLILDTVQATSQRDYRGLCLCVLSRSNYGLSGLEGK